MAVADRALLRRSFATLRAATRRLRRSVNPELPHLEGVRLLTECWEKQDEPDEAA
jgi:hypothetical protein